LTLGQSSQTISLTGLGPDAQGNGISRVTWSDCSFDGTATTCALSGPFTGLGPGGTWDLALVYPGNGPSPVTAITPPGSDLFRVSLSSGTLNFVFNESNGTTVKFAYLTGQIFFVPALTSCTGSPANCGTGAVGQKAGATISGPVNGSFNATPIVQAAISASAYGGFPSIAPGTWVEIYGLNVATTLQGWSNADFHGIDAPTALGGTTVTVGGKAAFVDFVSPGQVDVLVPSDVATGSQPLVLTTVGGPSDPYMINVNATEPGLLAPSVFEINQKQYAVALFVDNFYVLPPHLVAGLASRRAVPGDTIILYGIGFGSVMPDSPAGIIAQGETKLTASVDISIGGVPAQVAYAGLTPGSVGLYQFNVVVPNIPPNDQTPLTFKLGGVPGTQRLFLYIGQ
jgi:uncharacterized protein (TIGR03437 family)